MKKTHHPPLTHHLALLTRKIPSSDRTRDVRFTLPKTFSIISNTSSQGELSYCASSLHVAFTAQRVTLTIPWCRAKWNYRQRESSTQRLCGNHALTSARLAMHRKWSSSYLRLRILSPSLTVIYPKSPRKIGLVRGCSLWISHAQLRQEEKQICRLFKAHKETINPAIEEKRKVLTG